MSRGFESMDNNLHKWNGMQMKKDISGFEYIVNIVVFLSILATMLVVILAIENNLPKETLGDKLLIVLAYIIGFIILYYITNIIYGKYLRKPRAGADPQITYLFSWVAGSLICLSRVFFPSDISAPITNQPEITKSLNNANTEGKIKILKANGLSKESVYDVLKNDYNFKILIKDGNSTFEKIYDNTETNIGE
jgi:hypothetical protein